MSWAFWRRDKSANVRSTRDAADEMPEPGGRLDATAQLKIRARRRLIGAAVLLLAAVVVVPMILDPTPRPLPDSIPIDIPSEREPFTPRLSLPPLPESAGPAAAPDAEAPAVEAAPEQGTTKAEAEPAKQGEAAKKSEPVEPGDGKKADPAKTKAEPAKPPAPATEGRYAVQAAAMSTDKAAQDLSTKLKKGGLAVYVERIDTKEGVRFRVRVGPFASRDAAEAARARLAILGISGSVVEL
jgi:DedD protein